MPRDHRLYLDDIVGASERIQAYVKGMDYLRFAADQKTMMPLSGTLKSSVRPREACQSRSRAPYRRPTGERSSVFEIYSFTNTSASALEWCGTSSKPS